MKWNLYCIAGRPRINLGDGSKSTLVALRAAANALNISAAHCVSSIYLFTNCTIEDMIQLQNGARDRPEGRGGILYKQK